MANLEVADETAERVLGHSLGGLMATYNVSRHRKQKMAALVALEAEIMRIFGNTGDLEGNFVPPVRAEVGRRPPNDDAEPTLRTRHR
jgi:hypothetical protein